MPEVFTLSQAFAIAGAVVAALLGLIGFLLGATLSALQRDMRCLTKSMSELRISMPREYVRQSYCENHEQTISHEISGLRKEMLDGMQRLFDKLDGKADKS